MKKALITGITGQDGAYLAQLLLEKSINEISKYTSRAEVLDFSAQVNVFGDSD